MRRTLVVATMLVLALPLVRAQQRPPTPPTPSAPTGGTPGTRTSLPESPTRDSRPATAVLRGRVVRADTGQPLRRVDVRTFSFGPHTATTDDNGRYEIAKLPAGSYRVSASKGGFTEVQYGQRRPYGMGRPITLADGQVVEKIDFVMTPGSVITGRVVDEAGEPVVRAGVQAIHLSSRRRPEAFPVTMSDSTDDRGEFRIFDLAPGDYLVQASPAVEGTFAPTYYPGTPSRSEAQRITLKGGDEAAGISFTLIRARTVTVSGTVRNRDGTPSALAMIVVREKTDDRSSSRTAIGTSRLDGSFVIENIAPGAYVVDAQTMAGPAVQSPPIEITVADRDVTGLVLDVGKGVTATGRVRFDSREPPRDIRRDEIRIMPVTPDPNDRLSFAVGTLPGPPRDDWTFEVKGLSGRRLLRAVALGRDNWTMKSVMVDGIDVTDTPIDFRTGDVDGIEIVLTSLVVEINGGVTDDRGAKVVDGTVVAFSPDREKWGRSSRFIHRGSLDQDGRFTLRGLPPATYLIVAVDDLELDEEYDAEVLEQLQQKGTLVTLREGEPRTIELKITSF